MLKVALARSLRPAWSLAALGLGLAAALAAVGWFDYATTRAEFITLVRAQAASVRETVAAAARANTAGAVEAEAALAQRLLDNARLLAELDRRGGLTAVVLAAVAERNHLFRVTVLAPDGTREHVAAQTRGGGAGRSRRGPGPFGGSGAGAGPGGAVLIDRLISGGEREAVTGLHPGRRGHAARLTAGTRRANGGAILVSVDASEVARLQRQTSIEYLLADIVRSTGDVAYIAFDQGEMRRAQGNLPPTIGGPDRADPLTVQAGARVVERRTTVNGQPVLELTGPIESAGEPPAHLHLGMRLAGLRYAERRTLSRLAISLTTAATLGVLAIGLVWLRHQYGSLSVEHARAQDALRRRDRLAAMGELASTVAHEIRNPLNAIAMSAQRLERECFDRSPAARPADPEEAMTLVGVIQSEAKRLDGKVQQFLQFARPPALAPRSLDLAPWLEGVVAAMQPLAASRGVDLSATDLPAREARLDPEQMRQAVDNLLRNAIDATPPGGRVTLGASASPRGLVIEVRDTGDGIAPEHLPRIFDLYFTTKPEGTGVGLAVTQQIVAAHGGTIDVDSGVGRGTTMRIRIPAAVKGDPRG